MRHGCGTLDSMRRDIATYPQRAKSVKLRRAPAVSVLVTATTGTAPVRVSVESWGPVATGGFPPELAD